MRTVGSPEPDILQHIIIFIMVCFLDISVNDCAPTKGVFVSKRQPSSLIMIMQAAP
ncbi:hypothetical protein EGR_11207 [Echinococcus granulosus]|uniref:Uncharacterized protein n=1 Tax=Echinococcus granulosus TaxID=6210 RepID=W6U0H9_ECHGR|nr:hypothetical protein EGR_11207 [Echinococcus granulosus]EUB53936.1 hypothetical protein EGR_11207 [Echinococcus granulosus]